MSKSTSTKEIKMRRCIACREVRHKTEFIRAVKTPEGNFIIDLTGKAAGRGAYICKNEKCAAEVKKRRRLDASLKTKVPAEIYDELCKAVEGFKND